ncbi:hypothetical protein BZA70DRAFT_42167 [Myxozyma melibiosi]|uniref:F-box domain-containing protein n=1 Tax=Myxozyma melibiosi TaxID=54550 RepID=A0ABR1FFV1_9ASCO
MSAIPPHDSIRTEPEHDILQLKPLDENSRRSVATSSISLPSASAPYPQTLLLNAHSLPSERETEPTDGSIRIDPATRMPPELFIELLTYIPYPFVATLCRVSKTWNQQVSHYLDFSASAYSYLDFSDHLLTKEPHRPSEKLLSLIQKSRGCVHTIILPKIGSFKVRGHERRKSMLLSFWRELLPDPAAQRDEESAQNTVCSLSKLRVLSASADIESCTWHQPDWSRRFLTSDVLMLNNLTDLSVSLNTADSLLEYMSHEPDFSPSDSPPAGAPSSQPLTNAGPQKIRFPNLIKLEFYYDDCAGFFIGNGIVDRQPRSSIRTLPKLREFNLLGDGECRKVMVFFDAFNKLVAAMPVLESLHCRSCFMLSKFYKSDGATPESSTPIHEPAISFASDPDLSESETTLTSPADSQSSESAHSASMAEPANDRMKMDLRKCTRLRKLQISNSIMHHFPLLPEGLSAEGVRIENSWLDSELREQIIS